LEKLLRISKTPKETNIREAISLGLGSQLSQTDLTAFSDLHLKQKSIIFSATSATIGGKQSERRSLCLFLNLPLKNDPKQ